MVILTSPQIDIFLWPYLAVLLERRLYDARNPTRSSWKFWRRGNPNSNEDSAVSMSPDTAISIRNLGKDFDTSIFSRGKGPVTAISDLSLEIPKFGIYVLLGSNGYV